jgi:hypothetical protein
MGDLNQPDNTFWQAFVLSGPKQSWSLVTPKGVADNGGLVGSFGSKAVVLGFEASQLLAFSPVAVSNNDGARWSPGVFPDALAPVPNALATTPAGLMLALLGKTGSSIVASDDDALTPVSQLATLSSVAANGRSCKLAALTAVTFGPSSVPMAGGLCEGSSQIGIFERTDKGWRLVGPMAPKGAMGADAQRASASVSSSLDTEVLRLSTVGSHVVALAETVATNGTSSLFRLIRSASGAWTGSPVFAVPPAQRLTATGTEPNGSIFVLLSHAGTVTAEVLPTSGASWTRLPALPTGTATLAFGQDGRTYALSVHQTVLTVYNLRPSGTWDPIHVIIVPIQFGSSS